MEFTSIDKFANISDKSEKKPNNVCIVTCNFYLILSYFAYKNKFVKP